MNRFRCCAKERLRKCFNSEGGRLTFPRRLILDFLHSNKGHFTAEEIYDSLNKKNLNISLATVYRTLNSLWQSGILKRFDFGEGKAVYELSEEHQNRKHHHHLICKNCGQIIEYDDFIDEETILFKKLEKQLSEKHNFKIEGHNLYFYGLCHKCEIKKQGN